MYIISFLGLLCENGVRQEDGDICCGQCGGQCGGDGCEKFPGEDTECCVGTINQSGEICEESSDIGCIMLGR